MNTEKVKRYAEDLQRTAAANLATYQQRRRQREAVALILANAALMALFYVLAR